ncbi:MAG: ABC transporter ATP-binding protein [Pseudomonadota bacterium]
MTRTVLPAPVALPRLVLRQLASAHAGPFDLAVAGGECVCIVGKSGSGKSLLLRLIADLDPGSGSVELSGQPRDSWSAPQWRRQVLYQAAEPAWWAPMAGLHFPAGQEAAVQPLLEALGLPAATLGRPVALLSTGERQRLALARSLARCPEVLLLDEPTASLDPASTLQAEALLRARLDEGMAMLLVTHSHEQAARMGHRRFEMAERRLRAL